MLVGDMVPKNDKNYYCLLLLIKISKILLSPVICKDIIPYLEIMIEEKIMLFKELYTATAIIPKMHYMVHYASQLYRFGPLTNTWTMRQEAKLSFVKRASQRSNFKNISKSIAKKHQFWLSYKLEFCPNLIAANVELGKAANVIFGSEPSDLQQAFQSYNLSNDSIISHHKWVQVQSTMYKIGMFVVLEYNDINAQFGKITDITVSQETIVFQVHVYNTDYFDEHFMSFVMVVIKYINSSDLFIHDSIFCHKSLEQSTIHIFTLLFVLKYF